MKKSLLITAALLIGSASYTYANAENFKPLSFQEMDKNGDALLSKEEVRGRLLADFAKLDKNADGQLSAEELPAPRIGGAGEHHKRPTFEEMDKNGDGVLSKDEMWKR